MIVWGRVFKEIVQEIEICPFNGICLNRNPSNRMRRTTFSVILRYKSTYHSQKTRLGGSLSKREKENLPNSELQADD